MKQRVGGAAHNISRYVTQHKRELMLIGAGLLALCILAQLFYPSSRLLPHVTVDDITFNAWQKTDASRVLDEKYAKQPVELYFGETDTPQLNAKPADIGLTVKNAERLNDISYPWYMRLIPTSALWYGRLQTAEVPTYQRDEAKLASYIKDKVGGSCKVAPINASLKADGGKVTPTAAVNGGTCELDDVEAALSNVKPELTSQTKVSIEMDEIAPDVSDDEASQLAGIINEQLAAGVTVKAGDQAVKLEAKDVASWLRFAVNEKKLVVSVDAAKSEGALSKLVAPKVAIAAGVSKVKTRDFVEVSRVEGSKGRALNVARTGDAIASYLTRQTNEVAAVTTVVEPRVEYSRTYSPTDTGISALIEHYAKDNKGVYGVQLIELSGDRRRAGYNESKQFVAASTYKLFVAYGTLKKIEAGSWKWSDQVAGGRDMAACFDDMIVKSDNPCAEALLERYGYSNLTRDIRALGLSSASGFIVDGPKTTAGDLALFMAMLESKQLPIKPANRDRLIAALKRNQYRQGIPAGVSGAVADKVGFLNGLLHDSSIVYSPRGTYVLVIMTDKSSWATIADLAKKIDSLRSK